ncbi:MAG TPA: metallothionein [Actinomycetes bacterium]|nr:metallothionein [Actinomycetes bacterium]
MAHLVAGTVLTCAHEHCACRVRIESECDCEGATEGSHYTCACGAPMVVVEGN